ncbi:MAG: hypothetical protein O3C21_00710 [Verrucomicrobia bacterium]|nr:hypothetical protein [Verrucomicrobiota bacterium]
MKKTLLILSAIAVSGTAFVIAQEQGDRPAPRGDRAGGRGAGRFANAPLFKAMKMGEGGSIALPKTDDEKAALLEAIAKCDANGDGKLERTEIFGEMRRGGGAGAGAGGARRPGGEGGADAPKPPASE